MLLTKHYYSRYTIVDLNPDAYAMIIQYLYNIDISLVNKVKVVETLCKITVRFGELLPHYVDKYNILNILCHICSSRSKVEDYCNTIGMEHQQISNDWSILRSSCLSNINDIILTLGIHSNRYILQILDIALGVLEYERDTIILLKRSALYLLHTIIFLNKTYGRYGNVKIETRKILMEKIRYAKVVLQNVLVNGIDVKDDMVCKYHIQSCLELMV